MRRDHRPYYLKKLHLKFQKFYAHRFLAPQFDDFGTGGTWMKPWHVEIFGAPVRLGNYATVIATPDNKVRFSVWSNIKDTKGITIGDYCLICPGVRISAALEIRIADSCMIAGNAYLTDSDWHDVYNRAEIGRSEPVVLEENVWVGDSVIICKGVTIGRNSIIGAGAVVAKDIPPGVIAAGNPAKVVRRIDEKEITPRSLWFKDPRGLSKAFDQMDRERMQGNTWGHWLKHLLFPSRTD